MDLSRVFDPDVRHWAEAQWGAVELGDARLRARAVEVGVRLTQHPSASLPQQMQEKAQLKGAYGLLKNPKVTHARLQQPHWEATRAASAAYPVVLMVQDTTELDYTRYAETLAGLGPLGDGRGRGLLLHSTLAVVPEGDGGRVLGLAHQSISRRVPIPAGMSRRQRPPEERESRLWREAVRALGPPPLGGPRGTRWVLVGDRGADATELWRLCAAQMDFLIRAAYDHRLREPHGAEGSAAYLLQTARGWSSQGTRTLALPATGKRAAAREAHLEISFGPVEVRTSKTRGAPGLPLWGVRAWEGVPPPGVEPVEWILVTTLPVETLAQAEEKLDWYTRRWLCEDYHQCLKTGCAAERRDLEQASRMECLLGFLALVAVRLLQLRQEARWDPARPASEIVPPLAVALLAARLKRVPAELSAREFWRGVAQLGGFLGRKRDGEPGWKTLWKGWMELDSWLQGIELASQSALVLPRPPTCG